MYLVPVKTQGCFLIYTQLPKGPATLPGRKGRFAREDDWLKFQLFDSKWVI